MNYFFPGRRNLEKIEIKNKWKPVRTNNMDTDRIFSEINKYYKIYIKLKKLTTLCTINVYVGETGVNDCNMGYYPNKKKTKI